MIKFFAIKLSNMKEIKYIFKEKIFEWNCVIYMVIILNGFKKNQTK
jgi:hypothetical protein